MSPRVAFLLPVMLLLGAGCGITDFFQKTTETVTQKAAESAASMALKKQLGKDVDVDVNKQGATFTDTSSGRVFAIGEHVSIPSNFPKDVPLDADCVPTSVSLDVAKGEAALLCVSSKNHNDARDWYEKEATSNGWALEQHQEIMGSIYLSFIQSDQSGKSKLLISITTGADGKTNLMIARSGGE